MPPPQGFLRNKSAQSPVCGGPVCRECELTLLKAHQQHCKSKASSCVGPVDCLLAPSALLLLPPFQLLLLSSDLGNLAARDLAKRYLNLFADESFAPMSPVFSSAPTLRALRMPRLCKSVETGSYFQVCCSQPCANPYRRCAVESDLHLRVPRRQKFDCTFDQNSF